MAAAADLPCPESPDLEPPTADHPVQLPLDGLPLRPEELAKLSIYERTALFNELDLDPMQRQAAEEAARLIRANEYRKAGR